MDKNKFPIQSDDIWYSNEKRMKSIWRVFKMDDRGRLDIYEKRIRFNGEKYRLNINNVKNIFITRPTLNYGANIISELFSIIFIWYIFFIVIPSIEYFLTFFIIIIILYPVSLFLTGSDWIGIEFKDRGNIKRVYFTDGSFPEGSVLRRKNIIKKSKSLLEKFQLLNIDESN